MTDAGLPPGNGRDPGVPEPTDLRAVAERIAQAIAAAESTPAASQPRAIVFHVGSGRFGLPLDAVREVVLPPTQISTVPRAPAAVLGIMNLRGRVLALVDLAHALPEEAAALATEGAAPPPPGADLATGRVLILERGRREVGLLVREVEAIAHLGPDNPTMLDPERIEKTLEALLA